MQTHKALGSALIFILALTCLPVAAQDITLDNLDFSGAHLHVAGPDTFYVRGVGMAGREISMKIATTDGRTWRVIQLYDEGENLVPQDMVLDFATAARVGERQIRLEGLFLEGTAYGGTLEVRRDGSIVPVPGSFEESEARLYSRERGDPLLALILDLAGLRAAEQELAELRAERDELAANQVGLAMERERLAKEREILLERVQQLDLENQELRRQLTALANATETDGIAAEEPMAPEPDAVTPGDPTGDPTAGPDYQELTAEITRLAEEIRQLRADLADDLRAGPSPEDVEAEIARLRRENDRLREELLDAGYEAFAVDRTAGFVDMARAQLTASVLRGFSTGQPQIGRWDVSGDTARQTDSEQFFAKMTIPFAEGPGATLYAFEARTLDPGWVGLGMHIEVSDVELRGYGLGKSMLIWFTRDRDAYGHELTHLQIYRSDDDVNMERVADAVIPEVLSELQDIGILYEPTTRYVTVAVDGVDRLRFSTWFDLEDGATVALRSLGAAEFRNLTILGEAR